VLRSRSYALYGIVNGINYNVYDPETDRHLFVNYRDSLRNKRENKLKLQKMLGLPASRKKPMLIMITRLVEQKGLDLVKHVLDEILQNDLQMVVLGTGEERYEQFFRAAGHRYPEKLSANITFNTDLAHKMYAAGDMFLMPSRFEPCGIGQLISFRYLTVPIVRETGGLVDTVIPYNEETGEGNGFSFSNYNAHDMLYTIERALQLYNSREIRDRIHENILKGDYSWKSSAEEYNQLYQELL
ncbi:MAG: glycogen synthase, partial [Halanaerobiales bacterium]